MGFVKAMDEFRGMKLVRKEGDKNLAVSIAVEFDRTKHLSDSTIKKRKIVRDRLIATDREKEELEKKRLAEEEAKKDRERFEFILLSEKRVPHGVLPSPGPPTWVGSSPAVEGTITGRAFNSVYPVTP